ncbi:MAG: SGNH/GDSL hydrolase family protein [Kiritimatiellaeota bacterium]|nr:SGNH/GDSL hydrolase family protein [Kiritimatiellota bacterium]
MKRLPWLVVLALACAAQAAEPLVKREPIEWCDIWIAHSTETALPRVLLIGDSITRGYSKEVEHKLDGRAYVGRLATSKSLGDGALLEEIALVLRQYKFAVIHFNNGMHGWTYTEEEYGRAFPQLLALFKQLQPQARLIWATTTPVREGKELKLASRTERVKARNQLAQEFVAKAGIPVDDLFALCVEHPEFSSTDGVHASAKGIAAQAAQVAASITAQLR